ncbi:glycosyltransferase family 2 protein [Paenibacillus sp. J5C_2022]|uniref:glycosyltransferase family 2 protein n=1 Tax=Paenibacillus sp. J5C2022 TaxID=2977129 RepID=UPI0021CF4789|nr:glycosyltransferase family 2 protein [Paenibacillus sp. J5C2022]MCU6709204.1 glycosyltransferase family 2 protein [Paenibacillus sp. J5C2022]
MSAPTVSVCIVTYNSAKDIGACLEAVSMQTIPVSIVIVDNASADRTLEAIREHQSAALPINLIRNTVNNGFAGGQNQAIRATDSDYVLVLNPDVRLEPDYVEKLIAWMEQHPKTGSATGQLVLEDRPDLIDSTGLAMGLSRNAKDRGAGEAAANWSQSGEVFGVSGAASMYSRRMIDEISLDGEFFDEQFFAYKEDVDVAWRAQRLGWKSQYVSSAKAVHARGWKKGGRSSIPLFVRQHSYMNRFYTLLKNESIGWHLLLVVPVITILEALKLGYILLREPALLKCVPTLARTIPNMLRKRKMINRKSRRLLHEEDT